MTYEELVKRLRSEADFPYNDNRNLLREAADAIENTSKAYQMMAEAYEAEITKQEWIPVTEEPPLKVGDDGYNGYLVYANGYYEVADYTTDKLDDVPSFHVDGEYEPTVTHFMPLPEPPKEETE
jgi:hypothetical protein